MNKHASLASRLLCSTLIASMLALPVAPPVLADPPDRDHHSDNRDRNDRQPQHERSRDRSWSRERDRDWSRDRDRRYVIRERDRDYRRGHYESPRIEHRGRRVVIAPDRVRRYRDVVVVRPYGHWYSGYAHYDHDDNAYKWLAFTAITLGLLNFMNEAQQREYEAAQVSATTAPIGERIVWQQGNASGYTVATREGTSTSGRYCREFQQNVRVGGRTEQAYGTACRNPDGSWQVISSGD
jgi:hypothetical protein